jgi:site-specific recombinase XerD
MIARISRFEAGLIPRRSFFISDFPFVSSVIMSSHEQDLPDTTLLCRCLSLGRFTKCASGPYCQNYFLHNFRHTFATEHLRGGIDIRTLQSWMGHRDIKSTMVYLKGVQSKDTLAKVNAGTLAAYAS